MEPSPSQTFRREHIQDFLDECFAMCWSRDTPRGHSCLGRATLGALRLCRLFHQVEEGRSATLRRLLLLSSTIFDHEERVQSPLLLYEVTWFEYQISSSR